MMGILGVMRMVETEMVETEMVETGKKKRKYENCLILKNGFNVVEENTFVGRTGGDCVSCMEPTKTVMMCCQASVCNTCFVEWAGNEGKKQCMHCRQDLSLK